MLQNNLVVMQAVDAGEVDAGIAYHYYWYRDREESGTDSDNSELYFFGDQDPGAFLSRLRRRHPQELRARRRRPRSSSSWLTSTDAQQAMAESYALEYPLNPDAQLNRRRQAVRRARPARASTSPASTVPRSPS